VTGGGTPAVESKEDYQTFRWAMVENLKRIDEAFKKLRIEVAAEHQRILAKHCGSVERFNEYRADVRARLAPFSKYLLPTGVYEMPAGIQRRFEKVQRNIEIKYPDIEKAGVEFANRQAELFAGKMEVSMVCCDYTEIPDDINAGYLDFLSVVILGRPLLRCVVPIVERKQRFDREYAAELLAKVVAILPQTNTTSKLPTEVAATILQAIFGDSAKE
jgi:hypothetical protein